MTDVAPIYFGSYCAGIEAASVASEPLGWRPSFVCEIAEHPRQVLRVRHRAQEVREPYSAARGPALWGDFTTLRPRHLVRLGVHLPDVICGGTPCQAFSRAGKRRSLDDPRGNLSLEFIRQVHAIDNLRSSRGLPGLVGLWENVPGVLNTDDNAFGCFLGGLVGSDHPLEGLPNAKPGEPERFGKWPDAGMVAGPRSRAAWRVLDAQYFGLAQRRRRVFVIFDLRGRVDPAAVLFEPQGLSRNPPARGSAGQGVAGTLSARAGAGGGLGTDFELGGGLTVDGGACAPPAAFGGGNASGPLDIAATLLTTTAQKGNFENDTFVVDQAPTVFSIMPMNSGRDFKARPVDVAQALCAAGPTTGNQGGDYVVEASPARLAAPILEVGARTGISTTDARAGIGIGNDGDPMFTLTAGKQHGVLIADAPGELIAFSSKDHGSDAEVDLAPTLRAGNADASHANAGVPPAIAYSIRSDAGRDGEAKTPSYDAAGNLRLRRPGLGIAEELAPTLDASAPHAVAFALRGREDGAVPEVSGDVVGTLRAGDGGSSRDYVAQTVGGEVAHTLKAEGFDGSEDGKGRGSPIVNAGASAVRRLTPVECERLQGFPDGFTAVPWRGGIMPDGPRYKMLGNSWAVPCARWIMERIDAQLRGGVGS